MTSHSYILEICTDSYESVQNAVAGGADRIELCSALSAGGVTPSLGLFRSIHRDFPALPICVLIRPRAGDFFYDAAEFEIMRSDIEIFKKEGASAFCFGILKTDGSIDVERCADLVRLCAPQDAVFCRAVDLCTQPRAAIRTLWRECGFRRVLTSGCQHNALLGAANLSEMVQESCQLASDTDAYKDGLSIMVGGGVTESNLGELARRSGAREFHASASCVVDIVKPSESAPPTFQTSVLHNNSDWLSRRVTQLQTVKAMRCILNNLKD